MQIIDLFSGIGGFSLAGRWLNWETIQFCEIDKFCQKVLSYHFPNVPIHDNVKTLDYEEIKRRINPEKPTIVVGGFPCQPYSAAGKRLGKEDDRHLWPYCIETIRKIKPNFCVFENVYGLVNWSGGLVFEEVQADLETEGYEVQPYVLPAASVGAPHLRNRVWFVAHANDQRRTAGFAEVQSADGKVPKRHDNAELSNAGDGAATDAISIRWDKNKWQRNGESNESNQISNARYAANTSNKRLQGRKNIGIIGGSREKQNEQPSGCVQPGWDEFPTQPPVRSRNDGLSSRLVGITVSKHRNESIKAYGNAIVPQVVYQIFKAIQQYEDEYK